MNGSVNIDVTRFVDDRRLSGFQIWIIVICFLTSFADGLDSQIMSVTLPFIRRDISLAPSRLGHLLSASQFGALIGALLFGLIADKWGRRPVIIASSVIFSVGTFATAYSHSFESLMFLRFFAGIGIGGAIPSYIALVAEYTPLRNRALVTAIIVSAVPCGGIFAGFIGAVGLGVDGWAIGWRTVFQLCGIISAAICVLTILALPESLGFLVVRGWSSEKIKPILQRIAADKTTLVSATYYVSDRDGGGRSSLSALFTEERRAFTLIYGAMSLFTYLALIGQLVWTPTLLGRAGMSAAQASLALGYHNIGAIVGSLIAGTMIDRFRKAPYWVIGGFFAGAAVAIGLVGSAIPDVFAVGLFSTLSGLLLAACSASLYSLAVLFFPTDVRSTGIGWGSAMSRVGAVLGPLSVGSLVSAGWSVASAFRFLGFTVLLCVVLMTALQMVRAKRRGSRRKISRHPRVAVSIGPVSSAPPRMKIAAWVSITSARLARPKSVVPLSLAVYHPCLIPSRL